MIDVLITCYNEENFIADCIETVIAQSRFDLINLIVIVDDGSTDGSIAVVNAIAQKNNKIRHIIKQNGGLANARNAGLAVCKSEFVAILDGDDLWEPTKIERQVNVIKESGCDFVYSGFIRFTYNANEAPTNPKRYSGSGKDIVTKLYLNGGPILPSTVLFRRELNGRILYFDEKFKQVEDTDYWLRYLQTGHVEFCNGALVKHRLHSNSLSADLETKYQCQMQLIRKINDEIPCLRPHANTRKKLILLKLLKRQFIKLSIFGVGKSVCRLIGVYIALY